MFHVLCLLTPLRPDIKTMVVFHTELVNSPILHNVFVATLGYGVPVGCKGRGFWLGYDGMIAFWDDEGGASAEHEGGRDGPVVIDFVQHNR